MQNSGAWTMDSKPDDGGNLLDGLRQRGQKELPAHYLYDALGSALFEAITLLPEYGLTRVQWISTPTRISAWKNKIVTSML